MSYRHCNGKHDLSVIMTRRTADPGIEQVARWCNNCGAVVIDMDVDGRVQPGGIMTMRFPRVTEAHVSGVDLPDGAKR